MSIFQVLLYNGQLDIIVAAPLTERFLPTVPWAKVEEYKNAERVVWKVHPADPDVAGYVRQAGEFYQVREKFPLIKKMTFQISRIQAQLYILEANQ